MATLIDSYSETNVSNGYILGPFYTAVGQSFTGDGKAITSVKFNLGKYASPTGYAYAKIYAHSGTFGTSSVPTGSVLATSAGVDVSTFPVSTSPSLFEFSFTGENQIVLTSGTKYVVVIEYLNGDFTNKILVSSDNTSPTASGNASFYSSSWSYTDSIDFCFYVYGEPSTGWVSPGTVGELAISGSDTGWSNENNIKSSNNNYANSGWGLNAGLYTTGLYASNFGFSVPSGATINGVEVRVERYGQSGSVKDYRVSLVDSSGSIITENKKNATNWASSDPNTYVTYGGSTELWGETWTTADVNDSDFGVIVSAQGTDPDSGNFAFIDHIQVKVYYTESSGTDADSERGLYIQGSVAEGGERGLYIDAYSTDSEDIGLYVVGKVAGSSEVGLYIWGGFDTSSNLGLYIEGYVEDSEDMNLYISGSATSDSTVGLYVEGYNTSNEDVSLYIDAYSNASDDILLYIAGVDSGYGDVGLYIEGKYGGNGEAKLYISGIDTGYSDLNIYIQGSTQSSGESNLYIEGRSIYGDIGLYIEGKIVVDLGLYIEGEGGGSGELSLYMSGIESTNKEIGLYVQGRVVDSSEVGLYLEGYANEQVERGLYIWGSDGRDSDIGLYAYGKDIGVESVGLYIHGSKDTQAEVGLYIEGFVDTLYSRESSASLKADDSNLSTMFSEQDYTDVATDDDTFVDLEGTARYFQLLFKELNGNENDTDDFKITWKGKSSLAPSSSAVYLQIYDRTAESWTTLVSNSSANANMEFTLEDTVSTNLSDYYDENYIISVRVYQDGVV